MLRPRPAHLLAAISLAFCVVLLTAFGGLGAASAAGGSGATITHIQPADHGVDILVSVPAQSAVELSKVSVAVDGTTLPATAAQASDSTAVARTAILLIDVSDSMHGAKLAAAKAAAKQYVASLPADVSLGIVTFAGQVSTVLAPTTDRSRDDSLIDALSTSFKTRLYDGVDAAVQAAGTTGQRSILLLSDGADVGSTATLSSAVTSVKQHGVLLDAVRLGQAGPTASALRQLAAAGRGRVFQSDTSALASSFQQEAGVLARQVLVQARFPAGFTQTSGQITITLPSGADTLTASALATDLQTPTATPTAVAPTPKSTMVLPAWALWLGVVAVALGLLGLGLALIPAPKVLSAEDRVTSYTSSVTRAGTEAEERPREDQLATAKAAAAGILKRSAGLEATIERRLEAAGSGLKPAEWLLVHAGVAFVAGLLGLLLGRGNVIVGLLFLAVGIVGPWVYLGMRRSRRAKAFNASLPDTLQLMSGSLSAGLSLNQSVDTVVREGTDPIASEFKRVLVETRLGVGLEDALDGIADRFDSDDFRWCVMAIRIQRQVGGNLAELLTTVSDTMRERQYLRRQVQTLSAEGQLSAWVLGALPPLLLVYMLFVNRPYVMQLFDDIRGIFILAAGVVWLGVGAFAMSRIVKVEV